MKKTKQRGAVRSSESEFVGAWVPKSLVALLDQAVRSNDTDRSKYFRAALREKLEVAK